jgi:hypothetical protein
MKSDRPAQIALWPGRKTGQNIRRSPHPAFAVLRAVLAWKRSSWTVTLKATQQESQRIHE